jgi:hypothetical protein
VLFDINSFDQWGVELGKELATGLLPVVEGKKPSTSDASTTGLVAYIQKLRRMAAHQSNPFRQGRDAGRFPGNLARHRRPDGAQGGAGRSHLGRRDDGQRRIRLAAGSFRADRFSPPAPTPTLWNYGIRT